MFKHELLESLCQDFSTEELGKIEMAVVRLLTKYDVTPKETALVVYDENNTRLLKMYLVAKKIEGLSEGTLNNYFYCNRAFLARVGKSVQDISANDVRLYLFNYKEEHQLSDRSLEKVRSYINHFFSWLALEGYIPTNPCLAVKPIKFEAKPRRSLNQEELEYIRKSCENITESTIIEFLYSTGCRIAELCIVKREDVNLVSGEVHLFGKGKKHRISYLNAKALVALREYLEADESESEYLFHITKKPFTKLSTSRMREIIEGICERANLPDVTPHCFRHATATNALSNGMPVQEIQKILGHANISTTMIYTEVLQDHIKADHKRYVV